MAEKLQFSVTNAHLQALLNSNITVTHFLKQLFAHEDAFKQMCAALQEYHRNDGGSPEVHAFDIENELFNADSLSGKFRCRFRVIYHYTCSDVRNAATDTIDWNFKIDHNTIYLTGEEVLERGFDEF